MVNKVIHDIEILDLVYTSNPIALSECQTSVIKPESDLHHSDHKLNTRCNGRATQKQHTNPWSGNPWSGNIWLPVCKQGETFGGTVSNIRNIGKNFAAGIVRAAEEANVPKYKDRAVKKTKQFYS